MLRKKFIEKNIKQKFFISNGMKTLACIITFFPFLVFAAEPSIQSIINKLIDVVVLLANLFVVLAVAAFLWGIVKFMLAAGNPDKIKEAKGYIIWGLVGMFVLISFMGIIALMQQMVFDGQPSNKNPMDILPWNSSGDDWGGGLQPPS